jgi:predicted transcriptional regulator of viral defense system
MNFLEFKSKMFEPGCFHINQVYAWQPGFDRNNFVRWHKKGLLIRLRQGYYTFPEYKNKPDFALFVANRIYRPSYISLHTALAFYGIIPEAVLQFTSVTSLKTAVFSNPFGDFSYSSVKDELMFGYHLKTTQDNRTLAIAWPEKALADLLYLYPFYKDEKSLLDLRLDEDFLHNEMDMNLFDECVTKFDSKALIYRTQLLKKAYNL